TLDRFTLSDIKATVSINTASSAKNLSGLITRINQTKAALGGLQSKNVNVNTASSAKNLTGLTTRVNQYKTAISSVKDKNVVINTATAAKNLSGTIAKIDSYNGTKIPTKTVKVNATQAISTLNSVISKIKQIPTSKTVNIRVNQSGAIPSNLTRSYSSPFANMGSEIQAQTLGIQQQLRSGVNAINGTTPGINAPQLRSWKNPVEAEKYGYNLFVELENQLKKVNEQLDLLAEKSDKAFGKEKIDYLNKQIELLTEQREIQNQLMYEMEKQQFAFKNYLSNSGFTFDETGNITNYHEQLIALEKELEYLQERADKENSGDHTKKQADDFRNTVNEIKKIMDAYLDVTFDDMPDA
ncbi:MAG: hypothetical protein ACRDD7_04960, partial [Peptostreptococcaceae bacterium]